MFGFGKLAALFTVTQPTPFCVSFFILASARETLDPMTDVHSSCQEPLFTLDESRFEKRFFRVVAGAWSVHFPSEVRGTTIEWERVVRRRVTLKPNFGRTETNRTILSVAVRF